MRIRTSSGKSTRSRRAICSGLQAVAHRSAPWGLFSPLHVVSGSAATLPSGRLSCPLSRACTYSLNRALVASFAGLGRRVAVCAFHCATVARQSGLPPRVAALRRSSRGIVPGAVELLPQRRGPSPSTVRGPPARRTTDAGPWVRPGSKAHSANVTKTSAPRPARTRPPRTPPPQSFSPSRSSARTPAPPACPASAGPVSASPDAGPDPLDAAVVPPITSMINGVLRQPVESAAALFRNSFSIRNRRISASISLTRARTTGFRSGAGFGLS
jgi:hypothetical protein